MPQPVVPLPIECRVMAGPERFDAFSLMRAFAADERRLNDALTLFVEREDYGFVWLAYREDSLVGCCSVGYAISTGAGGLVALVRDVYVVPAARRNGVATAMLAALDARLGASAVTRTEVPAPDPSVAALLTALGYSGSGERLFSRDR